MQTKSILQIVSGFKPSVDGMGDFARRLGNALWQQGHLRSHFVVYRTPQTPFDTTEILPNSLSYCEEASPSGCLEEIARVRRQQAFDCVLLHYGPYAYSSNGEPAAFVKAIEELAKDMRVPIFFHELYAIGAPWRRAFWTERQQRDSVYKLLRAANVAFTSNSKYIRGLEGFNASGRKLIKIPIFSNIGEPNNLRPLQQRSRQLVIFGQLPTRIRLYREHRRTIETVCRRLRIEKVVDVGSGQSPHIPHTLNGIEITSMGWMDEHALSNLMADSIAGIVYYWPDVWEKSGVIAAYQAHALVPILVELEPRRIPEPPFLPYVLAERISNLSDPRLLHEGGSISDASLQEIADAAHDYYLQNQSVNHCAATIAANIAHSD